MIRGWRTTDGVPDGVRRGARRAARRAARQAEAAAVAWEQAWLQRPVLRGWLHVGALPAALVSTATLALRRRAHRRAVVAYGAGLSAMLATSAGYHRLTRSASQYRWTQPADHMMIFAAIAGSATPVVSVVLPPRRARPFFALLWGGAALGAVGRLVDLRRGTSLSGVAYLVLGWSGVVLLPTVVRNHGLRNGVLLTAGGAAYSLGAGLFAARKPDPFPSVFGYHEVWHAATLVGAACHLAAIADMTRDPAPDGLALGAVAGVSADAAPQHVVDPFEPREEPHEPALV